MSSTNEQFNIFNLLLMTLTKLISMTLFALVPV